MARDVCSSADGDFIPHQLVRNLAPRGSGDVEVLCSSVYFGIGILYQVFHEPTVAPTSIEASWPVLRGR